MCFINGRIAQNINFIILQQPWSMEDYELCDHTSEFCLCVKLFPEIHDSTTTTTTTATTTTATWVS